MRVWTNTTFRSLDLLAAPLPAEEVSPAALEVGAILDRAVAAGATCTLTRQEVGHRRLPIVAALDRVGPGSLSIGRPRYRPGQKGLVAGERLEISIGLPEGRYLGETHVVAKFAPDGDGGGTIACRLARPTVLVLDDRRGNERVDIAYAEPPHAEMLCAPRHKPLGAGQLVDVSTGGMRVRAINANVRAGDRVVVRAKLSEEIRIHAMAIVMHAGAKDDGSTDVGLRFQTEQPEIERFIRMLSATTGAQRTARRAG